MRRRWLVVVGGLMLATAAVAAEPVQWTVAVEPATARPGEVVELVLTAAIDPAYHIYAATPTGGGMVPTSFTAEGLELLGGLREPEPHRQLDLGFGVTSLTHAGPVTLRQPLRLPATAASGPLPLVGVIEWQACTDVSCLPPARTEITATVTIEAGPPRPERLEPPAETIWTTADPAPAEPVEQRGSAADAARARGLGAFLVVAFLAGLAALLTPCVFPMIPITVSFFTKQAGDNARQRVGLAGAYGLGIVGMYTTLGLLLAATMGASGVQRVATNPWVNLAFAALFVFFALSLFGLFELQLPSGLVNKINRHGDAGGYVGALFMGLTLTLAAFTCTVQFVGGVLVWAANGEWLWPILGMLAFSTAFALPFVLLALFPQYLASLPKSGGWLEHTKIVLGWIEVGAAFKFLSNADLVWRWEILTRELVLAAWAGCAMLSFLYLAGWLRMGHGEQPAQLGRGRLATAALFAALALYFLWGLTGARLGGTVEALLPPPDYGRDRGGESAWLEDWDEALAAAAAGGRRVFVDFTGVTCTNCRWMEQNIFTRPEIAERLGRLVAVRLYTDTGARAAEYQRLQVDRYGTASLPFYAIVTATGETVATFDGLTRDPAEFAAFLDAGLAPAGS